MQNRAHPRHYRSEYVRGYLHRQAMCTAKGLVIATISQEISTMQCIVVDCLYCG